MAYLKAMRAEDLLLPTPAGVACVRGRLCWDKPPREADRLETLEKMLEGIERGQPNPLIAERNART
jgi:hypothetical protein